MKSYLVSIVVGFGFIWLSGSGLRFAAANEFFAYNPSGLRDDPAVPKKFIPHTTGDPAQPNGSRRQAPEHDTHSHSHAHQPNHRTGLVDKETPTVNQYQPQAARERERLRGESGSGHGVEGSSLVSAESLFGGGKDSIPVSTVPVAGETDRSSHEYIPKMTNENFNPVNQVSDLRGLVDMIERSSHVVSQAADLAESSTSLLKNVISTMLQGAQHLNLQIETMQRLSSDLGREIAKPMSGVLPLIEIQMETLTKLTKTVDDLMGDVDQIRSSFMGLIFFVPYVLGAIAGTFLMSIILVILLSCSMRRRSHGGGSVGGVKGEWTMQPTRHHGGSNPRKM